ncbi:MAG TPA: hypothetical protein VNX46_15255 [Candidatus Acidoferrum sp.]|nr:hypothetical protein [Candidatus Acidoferrum sp.]
MEGTHEVNVRDAYRQRKGSIAAFSRTDAAVTIVVSVVLLVMGGSLAVRSGQEAKEVQCATNLKVLGVAGALYEKENHDQLPYGYMVYDDSQFKTWDKLIFPFVSPAGNGRANAFLLRCPADTIPVNTQAGTRRRTYSMPTHDMSDDPAVWPPGPDNHTGIGLWWAPGGWGMADLTNVVSLSKNPGLVDRPAYLWT